MTTLDATYFYLGTEGKIHNEPVETYVKFLSVTRVREKATGKERLAVELFDKQEDASPYATAYLNPLDLHGDIHRLREYGFVAPRKETQNMARTLEEKYHALTHTEVEGARTLEGDIGGILRYICVYVSLKKIDIKTINNFELYCIPVNDFSKLFKDSQYNRYSVRDIRRLLCDLEYIICTTGRATDYTIVDGEKRVKVIALNAESPDVADTMREVEYDRLPDEAMQGLPL